MTCSMRPCLLQVETRLLDYWVVLRKNFSYARLGLITHGDYDSSTYVTRHMNFTNYYNEVQRYVSNVEDAGSNGWNNGEAYEKVLNVAKTMNWSEEAEKILIVIGDDIPHIPTYSGNKENLDWRKELSDLHDMGVLTYGVHAPTLSRERARFFYSELSKDSLNGEIIPLNQFIYIVDILIAVIYRQEGAETLEGFEKQLEKEQRYNRNEIIFNNLLERDDTIEWDIALLTSIFGTGYRVSSSSSRSSVTNPVFGNLSVNDLVEIAPTNFKY